MNSLSFAHNRAFNRAVNDHGSKSYPFLRAEEGTVTVFAVILFVLMTMIGGLAIDLMKYEQTRTTLQNTLDRSTLAAASLSQALDPETVVHNYFDAAGMSEHLKRVEVNEGLNFREVMADAEANTQPYFLHMIGVNEFDAPGKSRAEQRISNVEIVLVLDVSGSMAGSRITNLRSAASEFVETVMEDDDEDRYSIAIVPYNAQVNLGADLRSKYQATYVHGVPNVNCLELPTSVYSMVGVPRNLDIPMSAFADVVRTTSTSSDTYVAWSSTSSSSGAVMDPLEANCKNNPTNDVRLPSNNVTQLKAAINGLEARGNTSITLGMKWGLSLIEPGARPMFNDFADANLIPESFRGRPFEFDDEDAMKVVVLMTDGEHVQHNRINDAYKTGQSPIWRSTADGNYSILHTTRPAPNQYWVPHLSTWQATPWNSGSGATRQNWQDVWLAQRASWVSWQLYARALGTSSSTRSTINTNTLNLFRSRFATAATMNTQLQQSCTLAKNNKVIVYGIAFEAPTNGQTQISQCSSSPSHYFNANGLEIETAFRTIASNITQLRLTQ